MEPAVSAGHIQAGDGERPAGDGGLHESAWGFGKIQSGKRESRKGSQGKPDFLISRLKFYIWKPGKQEGGGPILSGKREGRPKET